MLYFRSFIHWQLPCIFNDMFSFDIEKLFIQYFQLATDMEESSAMGWILEMCSPDKTSVV